MDVSIENLNKIEAESHVCQICDLECTTKNSLWYHMTKFHVAPEVSFNFNFQSNFIPIIDNEKIFCA